MKYSLAVLALSLLGMGACTTSSAADRKLPPPPGKNLKVYHMGNSLTRCIPLERLQKLFESAGGKYEYGMQLGGGHRLEQHLSMRNHGNAPGEGEYNLIRPYGKWDHALQNYTFDALILQPFMGELEKEVEILNHWPWFSAGDLQAASAFITYARAQTKPGKGRWDWEHPNTENVATDRFYIYASWPGAGNVLAQEGGPKTFARYWASAYEGGVRHCRDFFTNLVVGLNERHPDLPVPVRMIPVGDALAELDKRIRAGNLPGIEGFYARKQAYFMKSRRNNKKPSPFDPDEFVPSAGVLNFYADGVHMNDQPHNGGDSGTIGSYVSAITHHATLSGNSPVGLTVEPYEQFDAEADAALIKALQETVWNVVAGHPHTGVPESKAD
jgi:hypothetical protein